jgi:hypothetical protein
VQNLDEIGVFGKVGSMKSGVLGVLQREKGCDESEKYTHFARESDVLRLVEEPCRLVKNY